jgi:hypothetical protein
MAGVIAKKAENARATLLVTSALEPATGALLRRLQKHNPNAPILDASLLNESLSRIKGVETARFSNTNSNTITGALTLGEVNDLVKTADTSKEDTAVQFIALEATEGGGALRVTLDRQHGPAIIERLSEEAQAYLSSLMAPIATGEELSEQEYLALVESVYDAGIAKEIATATIALTLTLPGDITAITGGTQKDERKAEFTMSVLSILTLERPLELSVSWRT